MDQATVVQRHPGTSTTITSKGTHEPVNARAAINAAMSAVTTTTNINLHPVELRSMRDPALTQMHLPREFEWESYLTRTNTRAQLHATNFAFSAALSYPAVSALYHRAFSPSRSFLARDTVTSFWLAYTRALLRYARPIDLLQRLYFDAIVEAARAERPVFLQRTRFLQLLCNGDEDLVQLSEGEERRWVERVRTAKSNEFGMYGRTALTLKEVELDIKAREDREAFAGEMFALRDQVYDGKHPRIRLSEEVRAAERERVGGRKRKMSDIQKESESLDGLESWEELESSEPLEEEWSPMFREALEICADQDILWSFGNSVAVTNA